MSKPTLLETAKRHFKLAVEAEARQREQEREDLRFQVPELQWDEAAARERRGGLLGGSVVPPRPMISISKLDQPIQLILNQERQAKLGVQVHPVSEDADEETAEVFQGLYRRIERDSQAHQARTWAFDRAVKCGRGVYRVSTQWDEESDPETFDQEITIERILHQDMVYFDPAAQRVDFSDGNWAFQAAWMPIDDFKRQFPTASVSGAGYDLDGLAHDEPEWVRGAGDQQAILVTEYWYKVHETETLEVDGRKREIDRVSVKWCKLTGSEVLEEQDRDGKYIPLIPVLGRELQSFDGRRIWTGVIGPARDAQRLYNFAASTLVERLALEPKTPFVGVAGQFEGHEDEWQQINMRNLPYVEYKPTTVGGQPAPPPQRAQIDQSGMSLAMMALRESDNFLQVATSIFDPSLGKLSSSDRSGKAIMALQQQSDAGTGHFLSSLADISLQYEARVVMDLIPHVYDRPGRITRVLGGEDETKMVMLNQPFAMDRSGRPVPAPQGQGVKLFDLRRGRYTVSVSIGKSNQTRLEQGAQDMGELLSARPELMPILGDLYFRFRDFPGAKEIADRLKKLREKQYPGLGDDEQQGPTPEQAQAQMQAMQQQMQLLQAQLQGAMEQIKTDQAKQQAMLQKAEMDNASRERIAAADNQTKLVLEGIAQKFEALEALLQRSHEQAQSHESMAHETAKLGVQGSQERKQSHESMAHEAAMAAMPEMALDSPEDPGTMGGV